MPNLNDGGATHMHVHGGVSCPSDATQFATIAFDLSSLPADTIVFAATLEVWTQPANTSTDVHTLHRINETWVEGVGDDTGVLGGSTYTERDTGIPWTLGRRQPREPRLRHSLDVDDQRLHVQCA